MALSPTTVRRNIAKLEATHSGIHARTKEVLPGIVEKMTWGPNETVLDHGYNSGKKAFKILAPLAEKTGSTIYVVDNCPHKIEHAETNNPHARINHMLCDLSLPPGSLGDLKFNKIFSLNGFYFTPDYKSALKSMYEHLLPGGEAFFMIPTEGPMYDLHRLLIQHPEWTVHSKDVLEVPDYADNNTGTLKDAFIAVGFEIKEFDVHAVETAFKNVKEAADAGASANPFMLLLPKNLHDDLEEYYHKFFLETKTELYTPGVDSPDQEYRAQYSTAHVFVKKPE